MQRCPSERLRSAKWGQVYKSVQSARYPGTPGAQLVACEMGVANHLDGEARERRSAVLAAREPRDHESNAWLFETDRPRPAGSEAGFFGRFR
jgi:hypothetical protein